ncbi:UNVERIFIED_CONTAM: putative anthocyanidin reductase [Sesamum indicum]
MDKNVKVCVSGGAGYLASFLVKQLLERGYTVHATLRTLGDASKVGLLQGLQLHHQAGSRLKLFEADIYRAHEFGAAIEGCEFVVHMATPLQHYAHNSQYKNTSEAAMGGVKIIMESCMRSNTVKKLIYTASVVAASPLQEDGSGYKDFMDETCWTPLNLSYEIISDYVNSKTVAEKEVLSYNGKGIEVVSLACGLVGGDTIQSSMAESMGVLISQATNDGSRYKVLRVLEDLLAKVPIAHIQDVTEAHIFSMENSHINGRFLCASAFLKSVDIASLIQKCPQNISIPNE